MNEREMNLELLRAYHRRSLELRYNLKLHYVKPPPHTETGIHPQVKAEQNELQPLVLEVHIEAEEVNDGAA